MSKYTKKEAKENEMTFGIYFPGVRLNREIRRSYEQLKGNKRTNKAISRYERNRKVYGWGNEE